jgi:uncharacterized protein YbjT (DUF2867 family)
MERRALLTGASGFVGGRIHDRLGAAGFRVRCLTRRPELARRRWPERDWVAGDARDLEQVTRALSGSSVAYYLVHGMGNLAPGWVERELAAAETFARAAEQAGVERIIYLGGVAPAGRASDHLRSRLLTGERLRAGKVPCAELRAGMIVGAGSASWTIVRDLAARLPAMVLPAWLEHKSQPVAIDDVSAALVAAASIALPASRVWDLPGPESLSGTEVLLQVARLMQRKPIMLKVPLVTPRLSSHWIRLVTRADYHLAAELVEGLTSDLIASGPSFWSEAALAPPLALDEAARRALAEEALSPRARLFERLVGHVTPRPPRLGVPARDG